MLLSQFVNVIVFSLILIRAADPGGVDPDLTPKKPKTGSGSNLMKSTLHFFLIFKFHGIKQYNCVLVHNIYIGKSKFQERIKFRSTGRSDRIRIRPFSKYGSVFRLIRNPTYNGFIALKTALHCWLCSTISQSMF